MKTQIMVLILGLMVSVSSSLSQYNSDEIEQAKQRLIESQREAAGLQLEADIARSGSYAQQQAEQSLKDSEQKVQRLKLEIAMLEEVLALKREYVTIFLIQGMVIGAFSAFVASQKNRRRLSWFALGFLFSLIALIALVAVPKRDATPQRKLLWLFVTILGLLLVVLYAFRFAEWIRFPRIDEVAAANTQHNSLTHLVMYS